MSAGTARGMCPFSLIKWNQDNESRLSSVRQILFRQPGPLSQHSFARIQNANDMRMEEMESGS